MMHTKKFTSPSIRMFVLSPLALSIVIVTVLWSYPFSHSGDFAIVKIKDTSVRAEVARDLATQIRGLSGRPSLEEGAGMLFDFGVSDYHAIWMKDMKFPIDIIWIGKGSVVDIEENAPIPAPNVFEPLPVYKPEIPAEYVLEVPAGFAARHAIAIGDRVAFQFMSSIPDQEVSAAPPGYEYFIETLKKNSSRGKDFEIRKIVEKTEQYQTFAISYRSGTLTISGIMNVPRSPMPKAGYPVLILNHGLIPASVYTTGRGSVREQNFFTSHGYVTIHPDYRGLASSSPNPAAHHDFYVGYTQDVISLVDAIVSGDWEFMDRERIGMWGHSMGGGIATRVMVLRPEVRAYVLFASISADVKDNLYELSGNERQWIEETYGAGEKGDNVYRKISPIEYFGTIEAPVQVHGGTGDTVVPIAFSEKIYKALIAHNRRAEFYTYPGEGHEFVKGWNLAARRSLQFFDTYVRRAP